MLNAKKVWFRPLLQYAVNGQVPETRAEAKELGFMHANNTFWAAKFERILDVFKRTNEAIARAARLGL